MQAERNERRRRYPARLVRLNGWWDDWHTATLVRLTSAERRKE
jgi:hypothetical protein